VSDAGSGSGILRLRYRIPLLFGRKSLKTVCFNLCILKQAFKWMRSICFRALARNVRAVSCKRVIFAGQPAKISPTRARSARRSDPASARSGVGEKMRARMPVPCTSHKSAGICDRSLERPTRRSGFLEKVENRTGRPPFSLARTLLPAIFGSP
jgi:hypothetical protein